TAQPSAVSSSATRAASPSTVLLLYTRTANAVGSTALCLESASASVSPSSASSSPGSCGAAERSGADGVRSVATTPAGPESGCAGSASSEPRVSQPMPAKTMAADSRTMASARSGRPEDSGSGVLTRPSLRDLDAELAGRSGLLPSGTQSPQPLDQQRIGPQRLRFVQQDVEQLVVPGRRQVELGL